MGVSGAGKSTLAKLLADSLGLNFLEADEFHSEANKARMRAGVPLEDSDRELWMNGLCNRLVELAARGGNYVLAHSALRRTHRERLRQLGFRTLFLHLDGDRELIARRMAARTDHYMPVSLLDSQIDSLEATGGESDIARIDVSGDPSEITAASSKLVDHFIAKRDERCV